MTLVYFDDLLETKKVALEMSEIDANHLKTHEAKFLIKVMKSYYLESNEDETDEKFALLKIFNQAPHNFKHMDLIDQLKKDKLDVEKFKKSTSLEDLTKGIIIKEEKEVSTDAKINQN